VVEFLKYYVTVLSEASMRDMERVNQNLKKRVNILLRKNRVLSFRHGIAKKVCEDAQIPFKEKGLTAHTTLRQFLSKLPDENTRRKFLAYYVKDYRVDKEKELERQDKERWGFEIGI
jgi:hypothetical protein